MPKGPQGQKRPADAIGNTVHIARIATGEEQETALRQPAKRNSGLAGAKARVENTTSEDRKASPKGRCGSVGVIMAVTYSPLAIANNFIEQFGAAEGIEHMKLQKLVYCVYGWSLAFYGLDSPRLVTEGPEIWKYGPVFGSLYKALKIFGRKPITLPQSLNPFGQPENVDENDESTRNLVAWIWSRYGHLTGLALSDLTHKPGTPWYRVATESNFRVAYNTEIPDEYILEEFQKLRITLDIAANNQDVQREPRQKQPT